MIDKTKKIAVAMSGGLDSSVAALLLKKAGYDVTGVNLHLWSCFTEGSKKTCCSPKDRDDARKVCEALEIPFATIDMREGFKEKVIVPFVEEYSKGRTPNPCIRCNTIVKFSAMIDWVEKNLGINRLATGHYARIARDDKGVHLLKGLDAKKDQTYFLFDILPSTLEKIEFPLGGYKKTDIREIAKEANLPVAKKAESQEVCFIPDNDVAAFIEDYYPDFAKPSGIFVDAHGKKLGDHRGTHAYTIGQRRGLGIGFGKRKYVTEIRPKSGEVVLGDDADLFESEMKVSSLNMIENCGSEFKADVKVRYKSDPIPALVNILDNDTAKVKFDKPVRAIAPGQAAVFYDGDVVIGGGWIDG